jgi:hypothetical protein
MEEAKGAVLVVMGVRADDTRELIAQAGDPIASRKEDSGHVTVAAILLRPDGCVLQTARDTSTTHCTAIDEALFPSGQALEDRGLGGAKVDRGPPRAGARLRLRLPEGRPAYAGRTKGPPPTK